MSDLKEIVYSKEALDFVSICVEYCAYLENLQDLNKDDTADKLTQLLPLLYLKATNAPNTMIQGDGFMEQSVGEDDYNYILGKMAACFAEDDVYLEVFMEEMKYSDTPISANISEDLTDIYQDVRNFITIYERGITEHMNDSLYVCLENFKFYWGQVLVNVLRAIHSIKYRSVMDNTLDFDDDTNFDSNNDLW